MKLNDDESRLFDAMRRNNPKGFDTLTTMLNRWTVEYYRECAKSQPLEAIYRAQGKAAALEQLLNELTRSSK